MSRSSATGLRVRLGRAASRLGGLPQRVVTWGREYHAPAAAVVVIGAAVATIAIVATAPAQPGGTVVLRVYPAAGAAGHYRARPPYPRAMLPPRYIGVYEPAGAGAYAPLGRGDRPASRGPRIAMCYTGWYTGLTAACVDAARRARAIPLIQIEPRNVSLAAIARGAYDSYLRAYADAVADYQDAVIIGFGPEMNEHLYPWGYLKTSPAVFVQAWRRIVHDFRSQNADNVIWIWTIGKSSATAGPLKDWWPGARYVTWVGIDGYYEIPGRVRLAAFFGTIDRTRRITRDPVLLFGNGRSVR